MKRTPELFESWRATMNTAASRKDIVTLMAMSLDLQGMERHMELLEAEAESVIVRDALATIREDLWGIIADVGAALDRVGRPSWPDWRGVTTPQAQAVKEQAQTRKVSISVGSAIIDDAVRAAVLAAMRHTSGPKSAHV